MDFLWNDEVDTIDLCCLLPHGISITLENYDITNTLSDVKKNLWAVFKSYPFYNECEDLDNYVFILINIKNYDNYNKPHRNESDKIFEIKPLFNILKIVERKDTSEDLNINQRINSLIGKNVSEIDLHGSQEINDFRRRITDLHLQIENNRLNYTEEEKFNYFYPLRLNNNTTMINLIKKQLKTDNFIVVLKYENHSQFTICVPYNILPENLLSVALNKMSRAMIKRISSTNDYILKVWDRDEYIFGNHSLINFVYIQETLSRNGVPTISAVLKKSIEFYDTKLANMPCNDSQKKIEISNEISPKEDFKSSWSITSDFMLSLHSIHDLNCDLSKYTDICVILGLFHADKLLCIQKESSEKPIKNKEKVQFEEVIEFPISLENLPRMTKLCIVIIERNKSTKVSSKSKKISNKNGRPLAWANTTIFDYNGVLKRNDLTLTTWTFADDNQYDNIFNPLGTVESNPRTDECATIKLTLNQYGYNERIKYPSEKEIMKYSAKVAAENLCKDRDEGSAQDTRTINVVLAPYLKKDKLDEMHDQDRNVIWSKRLDVLSGAHEELPILLRCVNWNKKVEVAEILSLLRNWKIVSTERALELLDYSYPDPSIRKFAICSLKQLEDEELLLYLLQLTQSIKHEAYLNCDLVIFLIERALKNQRIGHYFFWHLRSEMHVPCIQNKFGLLLEAFLKATHISQINAIQKQLEGFERLKEASELAKKGNKEKVKVLLHEFLRKEKLNEIFNKFQNPLNPSYSCKGIKVENCKVMDSKMKPLWIVLENMILCNEDISIIFKNGDDLRQDMLTLQMLRVMDKIWKNEGYDFRMNIYDCISMEKKMGMIEVVLNAETIANIQKKSRIFSATSPFKKGSIFAWIKEHNQSEEQLQKAIEEFTYSCAGYCVATYVLGVADRHSDNIMIKKNGQLFHIDFGHILGHFKEKFGFCRERVPFVLTHDFVYVINKGATGRDATEFSTFQKLCEDAFLILRKHGYLIFSLFSMMISTGLPELSSEKDLNYLKDTLVLNLSDEMALDHFRSKFSDALENSWTTSLNWATHNFSKNNK